MRVSPASFWAVSGCCCVATGHGIGISGPGQRRNAWSANCSKLGGLDGYLRGWRANCCFLTAQCSTGRGGRDLKKDGGTEVEDTWVKHVALRASASRVYVHGWRGYMQQGLAPIASLPPKYLTLEGIDYLYYCNPSARQAPQRALQQHYSTVAWSIISFIHWRHAVEGRLFEPSNFIAGRCAAGGSRRPKTNEPLSCLACFTSSGNLLRSPFP